MPKINADRDAFVNRLTLRKRWIGRAIRARRKFLPVAQPRKTVQAAIYDATFRSDLEAVVYHYARFNDHLPDLENPVWLNEKIRWQFLNHPNPLMTIAADKIRARDYLRLKGARIEAPKLIASGGDPEELLRIDLPETFVLKSSYGSGQNHIERPGMDTPRHVLAAEVAGWRNRDQWRETGEFHYRDIPKRWLVEELLPSGREMREYKVFCFQGEPAFIAVITERNLDGQAGLNGIRHAVFDLDWNRVDFEMRGIGNDPRPVPRPDDLEFLLAEARRLSEDFMHVRVDFLRFDGRLTFSELTFASLAARVPFEPRAVNARMGAMMDLSRAGEYLERGRRIAAMLNWPERKGDAARKRTGQPTLLKPALGPIPG